MGDPRNVAHDKKVIQEKHHKGKDSAKGAGPAPQPGKKAHAAAKKQTVPEERPVPKTDEPPKPVQQPDPTKLEKSLVVLSKLKELEFHSRANIEKLAAISTYATGAKAIGTLAKGLNRTTVSNEFAAAHR